MEIKLATETLRVVCVTSDDAHEASDVKHAVMTWRIIIQHRGWSSWQTHDFSASNQLARQLLHCNYWASEHVPFDGFGLKMMSTFASEEPDGVFAFHEISWRDCSALQNFEEEECHEATRHLMKNISDLVPVEYKDEEHSSASYVK